MEKSEKSIHKGFELFGLYFELAIATQKKNILWYSTYYIEDKFEERTYSLIALQISEVMETTLRKVQITIGPLVLAIIWGYER